MIDNVLMILKATMDHPEVDPKVFLERAHPLGMFEASALKAIGAFEASARGYEELYSTVLIKTPVGTRVPHQPWGPLLRKHTVL